MNKKLLKNILSTPSYNKKEDKIRDLIISFGIKNKIPTMIDTKGNVYLIKGELNKDEKFPCVVAHMDTVHYEQISDINENKSLIIHEEKIDDLTHLWATRMADGVEELTGCGGDDKAGIFICLELIKNQDTIIGVFFVEEEYGCKGSEKADEQILKDIGYFIEFDAPTNNWCSFSCNNVQLFDEKVFNKIKPILSDNNITNISLDPYTDVFKLKTKFDVACMNFFAGYYNPHSAMEFVVVEDIEKAIKVGDELIKTLGLNNYYMKSAKNNDIHFFREIQKWLKENAKNEITE